MFKKALNRLRKKLPSYQAPSEPQILQHDDKGIRFVIHDVTKATEAMKECVAEESLNGILAGESFTPVTSTTTEICSATGTKLVSGVRCQSLVTAVHMAFSEHRPLCLSPDMIWLTIAQGFAQHVQNDPESYRHLFVEHEGKETISITCDHVPAGDSEAAKAFWSGAVHEFGEEVHKRVGPITDVLVADFSTTGPEEKLASEIVMLEAFAPYFEFVMVCICGIPECTLEGSVDDWRQLKAKAECLRGYGLDWWLDKILPLCDQFIFAAEGNIDVTHWQNIHKLSDAYGYKKLNGWITHFIPYVKDHQGQRFTRRNPILADPKEASITSAELPSGLSQVLFFLVYGEKRIAMECLGGFIGVEQDQKSLTLRPTIGWAIRTSPPIEQGIAQLKQHASLRPSRFEEIDPYGRENIWLQSAPFELVRFYRECDGGSLYKSYHFYSMAELNEKVGPEELTSAYDRGYHQIPFCRLSDGSEVSYIKTNTWPPKDEVTCLVRQRPATPIDQSQVVAASIGDFLQRCVESKGGLFMDDEAFAPHTSLPTELQGKSIRD